MKEIVIVLHTEAGDVRSAFFAGRDDKLIKSMIGEYILDGKNFSVEQEKFIKVKNLMTGEEVEIPEDTPWCCRPDSETFWSM